MFSLGIDVGSTNVKVALVDDQGLLHGRGSRALVTHSEGDTATQDPDALLDAVFAAAADALAEAPGRTGDVVTIGVCSQYSSIVGVDDGGRPVTPLIMYMDQRGADHCWAIMERHPDAFGTWMERHGIPPIGAGLSLAHLLALQHDRPELHAEVDCYLEVMDLVCAALTGRVVANQCTMFTSQLCDNRTLDATEYDPELLAMSGVDRQRLPELAGCDEPVGNLSEAAAQRLGLSTDVVVQAAMNDTHAGAFATGVFHSDATGLMIGTTAVILEELGHPASDLEREIVTMPSPVPGQYLVMAENGLAGRPVAHALGELLASPTLTTAGGLGSAVDPFTEIAAAMAASGPGAGGVMFLPWLAGSLSPSSDPDMRGGYIGVGLSTTRADMVRATIEGTARNLRWLAPAVQDMTGRGITEITFGGGAARSAEWAQCVADVLACPVSILEHPDHSASRAVALVAMARHRGSPVTEVSLSVADRVEPDPAATKVHDEAQAIFEEAFQALLPIAKRMRQ